MKIKEVTLDYDEFTKGKSKIRQDAFEEFCSALQDVLEYNRISFSGPCRDMRELEKIQSSPIHARIGKLLGEDL